MDKDTTITQVKTALQTRGWTLHLKQRRQREYAYAARRTGKRVERRYLCAVSQLQDWLASPSSPVVLHGPGPIPPGAERAGGLAEHADWNNTRRQA